MKSEPVRPDLSVIVPVFNEEENVGILVDSLADVMAGMKRSYEVLLIDDGSTDGSLEAMREGKRRMPGTRILRHGSNRGLSAALATGFTNARGDIVITLDADLQNDPRDIPLLLSHLDGADAVVGWRAERMDPFVKRISSRIANWIRNRVVRDGIHDTGCTLKVFRRGYTDRLKLYDGLHRFLPALLQMEGAKVVEVKVRHHPRRYGTAKYHLTNRLAGPFFDLLAVRWMQRRHIDGESEEIE